MLNDSPHTGQLIEGLMGMTEKRQELNRRVAEERWLSGYDYNTGEGPQDEYDADEEEL